MNKKHNTVKRLAEINVKGLLATTSEILERRELVNFLEKSDIIVLGVPKESGQFAFNTKEYQDLYLETFLKTRKELISNEH